MIPCTVSRAHERGGAAAEKHRAHDATRRERRAISDFGLERREVAPFVNGRAAHMAVEVAIGTFRQAERPVHIDPEAGVGGRARVGARGGPDHACELLSRLCQRPAASASALRARRQTHPSDEVGSHLLPPLAPRSYLSASGPLRPQAARDIRLGPFHRARPNCRATKMVLRNASQGVAAVAARPPDAAPQQIARRLRNPGVGLTVDRLNRGDLDAQPPTHRCVDYLCAAGSTKPRDHAGSGRGAQSRAIASSRASSEPGRYGAAQVRRDAGRAVAEVDRARPAPPRLEAVQHLRDHPPPKISPDDVSAVQASRHVASIADLAVNESEMQHRGRTGVR